MFRSWAALFLLRRGGAARGDPAAAPLFFLRSGACAPPGRGLRNLRESLQSINRASCGDTASLLRCDCKFVNFRKGRQVFFKHYFFFYH